MPEKEKQAKRTSAAAGGAEQKGLSPRGPNLYSPKSK